MIPVIAVVVIMVFVLQRVQAANTSASAPVSVAATYARDPIQMIPVAPPIPVPQIERPVAQQAQPQPEAGRPAPAVVTPSLPPPTAGPVVTSPAPELVDLNPAGTATVPVAAYNPNVDFGSVGAERYLGPPTFSPGPISSEPLVTPVVSIDQSLALNGISAPIGVGRAIEVTL